MSRSHRSRTCLSGSDGGNEGEGEGLARATGAAGETANKGNCEPFFAKDLPRVAADSTGTVY